jgi:HK97 family phage prohead protease
MRDTEQRHITGAVELRASDNGPGVLVGYASVFNRLSQNLGGFVERVDPDAFNKSLADGVPVVARFNHKDDFLLGTTESGTLTLRVDGTGLQYEVDLPDTTAGRDLAVLAKRGDVRYSSFAFQTVKDDWGTTEDDFPLRTLQAVKLVDVAPVVSPAYRDTTAGLRSLASKLDVPFDRVAAAAKAGELRSMLQAVHTEHTVEDSKREQVENHSIAVARRTLQGWSLM